MLLNRTRTGTSRPLCLTQWPWLWIPSHSALGGHFVSGVLAWLVRAMLAEQGLHDIHSVPVIPPNEHSIVGTTAQGQQIRVDVAAHGSGTGFTALAAGRADLVASSRPIKDRELVDLEPLSVWA